MTEPVLSCRGVIHDYDETPALLGVDLDVHEGEVVAITGPSGSGKSTLLLCLAGVIVPREGSVLLGGVDLRAVGERNRAALRRQSVGIVFQYGTLVPELTGEENVALPLLLSGRPRAEALKTASQWLARLGGEAVARGEDRGERRGHVRAVGTRASASGSMIRCRCGRSWLS